MDNNVTHDLTRCDPNLVLVRIKCFNDTVKSFHRDVLDGRCISPKLDWKIHRLLWIGYEKNCANTSCLFSKLSKDIIFFILEFFFIYKPSFITMKFDAQKTLNYVVQKYFEHLHENDKNMYNELLSFKSCEMKNINKIKLGDRIRLINCKIGTVKYIGTPKFVNDKGKVIGLELDRWDANACDGTICGKRVFDSSHGRAYFIHCNSYTNIVPFNLREGSHARLQGLQKEYKYNGKTVEVISWVSNKSTCTVRMCGKRKKAKYLRVLCKNLKPTVDWQDDTPQIQLNIRRLPGIENRVRTSDNQWGTVKWCQMSWSGMQRTLGLELDKWNPNANDGYGKNGRNFQSAEGRGYFVEHTQCVENVGVIDWPKGVCYNV